MNDPLAVAFGSVSLVLGSIGCIVSLFYVAGCLRLTYYALVELPATQIVHELFHFIPRILLWALAAYCALLWCGWGMKTLMSVATLTWLD